MDEQIANISILDLYDHISDNKFTIVGSPKGVGFSTIMANWIAFKMFFNNDFSIVVLTDCRKSQIDMLFKIKKAYDIFQCQLIQEGNLLYTKSKKSSGVYVLNYNEIPLETLDEQYDLIIVDKDDFSDYLYEHVIHLFDSSKQLIFNTYDLPQSIFHNLEDVEKVTIYSEYSKDNWSLVNEDTNAINYQRILLGLFKPL